MDKVPKASSSDRPSVKNLVAANEGLLGVIKEAVHQKQQRSGSGSVSGQAPQELVKAASRVHRQSIIGRPPALSGSGRSPKAPIRDIREMWDRTIMIIAFAKWVALCDFERASEDRGMIFEDSTNKRTDPPRRKSSASTGAARGSRSEAERRISETLDELQNSGG